MNNPQHSTLFNRNSKYCSSASNQLFAIMIMRMSISLRSYVGLLNFIVALFMVIWPIPSLANHIYLESAYLEDANGNMGIDEIIQSQFSPSAKVIARGYNNKVLWYRMRFDFPAGMERVALQLLPRILDDVVIFDIAANTSELPKGTSMKERFVWLKTTPGAREIYLRIENRGSKLIAPSLLSREELEKVEVGRGQAIGLLIGCLSLEVIMLLVMYVAHRDHLYMICMAHLMTMAFLFANGFGYLDNIIVGGMYYNAAKVGKYLILISGLTAILFLAQLLKAVGLSSKMLRFYQAMFFMHAPLMFILITTDSTFIFMVGSIIDLIAATVSIPFIIISYRKHERAGFFVTVLLLLIMINTINTKMVLLGWLQTEKWSADLITFNIIVTISIFVVILWLLNRKHRNALHHSMLQVAYMRQRADHEKIGREMKDRFMMMLLHEFKNPLSVIQIAVSSLARNKSIADSESRRMTNIKKAIDDLNEIIERCVQIDQFEINPPAMKTEIFSLNELLNDLRTATAGSRMNITGNPDAKVKSDYQYLRIILMNLITNALKYSPPETTIDLRIDKSNDSSSRMHFSVTNHVGRAGFPDPDRVFERYYRSDRARSQTGAGLGLWLAQEIASQIESHIVMTLSSTTISFSFSIESA